MILGRDRRTMRRKRRELKCVDWNATFVKMDKIMRQQPDYKVNPGESIKPGRNRKRDISLEERGMSIRRERFKEKGVPISLSESSVVDTLLSHYLNKSDQTTNNYLSNLYHFCLSLSLQ